METNLLKPIKGNPYQLRVKEHMEHKIWFTSDTHFNHTSILEFCMRPYATIEEMNEDIIRRWNKVVHKDDVVFHLGDFAYSDQPTPVKSIFDRLHGEKFLILGNHDTGRYTKLKELFGEDHIMPSLQLVFSGFSYDVNHKFRRPEYVWLTHYPVLASPINHNSLEKKCVSFNLHGHTHISKTNAYENKDTERMKNTEPGKQFDVGMDNCDYTPISYKQLIKRGYLNYSE